MPLRAALLLLAGVAVFALGLLPGHASGDAWGFSHGAGHTDVSATHLAAQHAHTGTVPGDGKAVEQHEHGADGSHGGVPFCHSARTSSTLTSPQSGLAGLTHLLTALLAAALVAIAVVLPFPRTSTGGSGGKKRRRVPIRLFAGPRLLLLDCVARV